MSLKVVSDFDFESRLALHAKRCKLKLIISTVYLKKCNFLHTESNIGNIYTISKISKNLLIFQGSRVEIRRCLARKWSESHDLHGKTCQTSGEFHRWPGVPSWRDWNAELRTIKNGQKKCMAVLENGLEAYGGERGVVHVRRHLSSSDDVASGVY